MINFRRHHKVTRVELVDELLKLPDDAEIRFFSSGKESPQEITLVAIGKDWGIRILNVSYPYPIISSSDFSTDRMAINNTIARCKEEADIPGNITEDHWMTVEIECNNLWAVPSLLDEMKKSGWGYTGWWEGKYHFICSPYTLLFRPDKGILAEEPPEKTV